MKPLLRLRSPHYWTLAAAACFALFSPAAAHAVSYPYIILADQPVAYYRFEDPANSSTIIDSSGSGAYVGDVHLDALGAYPKFEQPGIGSNSVSFHLYTDNGVAQNSHIEVPYTPDLQAHYFATVHLDVNQVGNSLVLSWPFGTLQQAEQVTGTYSDLTSATSPYTNAISGSTKFFRVKVQ